MLNFAKYKYVYLYLIQIVVLFLFSRAYQINIYGMSINSTKIFLLCCLIWFVALVCTMIYTCFILKVLKCKISIKEIHYHFAWCYILGTCINLVLYKFEYRKIVLIFIKTLFMIYKLYLLHTRYKLNIKKCIIFIVCDLLIELL